MWTGAGRDLIRFDYGNGRDTIFDFTLGQDRIDFSWTDMSAAVAQANAAQTGEGTLLSLGSGSVLLVGIQLDALDFQTDFLSA